MENEKVFSMAFSRIYGALCAKALRKGRTRQEIDTVTCWMTGYTPDALAEMEHSDITYGDFFRRAPALNPLREKITGKVCGVDVALVPDPLMR